MNTQKKNYIAPEMEVNEVNTNDIILSSVNVGDMSVSTDDTGFSDWIK